MTWLNSIRHNYADVLKTSSRTKSKFSFRSKTQNPKPDRTKFFKNSPRNELHLRINHSLEDSSWLFRNTHCSCTYLAIMKTIFNKVKWARIQQKYRFKSEWSKETMKIRAKVMFMDILNNDAKRVNHIY